MFFTWWTTRLNGLAPQVGSAVDAGYVEDSDARERRVAQVKRFPAALSTKERDNK